MANVVEVAERVGIVQRPVLSERLPVVASLNAVKHDEAADVGAGEELAVAVEVEAPHVATALAEQLESLGRRMISPDTLLELDAPNLGGDGASLQTVEPAVRAPGQRVCHRVGVFHAEAGEKDLGIAIGPIVAVAVGVEEQVRRLEDEDTAVAEGQPAREIQAGHEIMSAIDAAVSVDVFEDRDAIRPFGPARRRLGHAIVGRPRVSIDRDPLQPGRVGILQVLDDPEPAPVVKLDGHRLSDQRLARRRAVASRPEATDIRRAASAGAYPCPADGQKRRL